MGLAKETKEKKQKSVAQMKMDLVKVLFVVFSIIGGTLAWQSFSQRVTNETASDDSRIYEEGGRLHDYYDGTKKEVFIENYSTIGYGQDIYARIRLDEYYEFGEGAGSATADTSKLTIVRGDKSNIADGATPSITNLDTWDTYLWDTVAKTEKYNEGEDDEYSVSNIRTYKELAFGGATVYMPTFNKNIYSLEPELNGTYAGLDGERETDFDRYGDYYEYTAGELSDATYAVYGDPLYPTGEYNLQEDDETVHTAKDTLSATAISMAQWMAAPYNSEPGPYWVYDTDGWAYWAQPIQWQTATGLLINEIITVDKTIHSEWYYAVNVVAQIATAGDWGDAPQEGVTPGTGMFEGGFTTNGQVLLNKIAGITTE